MRRLILLLVLCFPLFSCFVYMAAKSEGVSIDELSQCKTHSCILSKGVVPLETKKNGSGDIIEESYQVQKPQGSAGRAAMHGVLDVFTLGLWEVAGTPIEGFKGKKEMYSIRVYYADGDKIQRVELVQ